MATIRALLVDDEPLANAGLRALLRPHHDVEVVAEALSGSDAVREIIRLSPDLVFLDVQMPRLDGFGVLREVMKESGGRLPAVVFVTAYDEFAVNAFEVQALDYLLKPVAEDRFRRALDRVRQVRSGELSRSKAEQVEQRLRALLDEVSTRGRTDIESRPAYPERLMVSTGARSVVVDVATIDWIGARDYCAELHVGSASHVLRESLAALESRLDPSCFLRVHRSAIINLGRVVEVRRKALRGLEAVMTSGARVPVSRNRRSALIERLGAGK
ncbi:MAG: LytTR family DNA-binding domain-containing protein [Gemmatimonadota bacterium]